METFCCNACGGTFTENRLSRRFTMAGDFCPACAENEKCGACGEMCCWHTVSYKATVGNYICHNCEDDFNEVAEYIKPLPHICIPAISRKLNNGNYGNAA
ncbi:MAG: hypothetical protein U0V74_07805 [Chitinophagales bacterium]